MRCQPDASCGPCVAPWEFAVHGGLKRAWVHVCGLGYHELRLNGEKVGEVSTPETVNYPTEKMWMIIGGVDTGTWQNFDGLIDEVRVYDRALSPAEIGALYNQPRR